MTFLNAKKVIMVSTCCLVLDAAHVHCVTSPEPNVASQVQSPAEQTDKWAGGKELKCDEIKLLNIGLELKPVAVVRMRFAYDATLRAIRATELCNRVDKKFIDEQIKAIVDPVRLFFNEIHTYASTVIPLVEESLLSKGGSVEQQVLERSNCLILKFFESKDALDVFFSKHVNTKEDLINLCLEFVTFFKDIRKNLSPRVVELEKAILKKITK